MRLCDLPPSYIKGVGPALEKKLRSIGIDSIQDLCFHLPIRYEDKTTISKISELRPNQKFQVQGEVTNCHVQFGRRRSLICTLNDTSGHLTLKFFHFNASQKAALSVGTKVRCYGDIKLGRHGPEIYHPEYRIIKSLADDGLSKTLTPIYPLTEGLQQSRLKTIISHAVDLINDAQPLEDFLPEKIRAALGFADVTGAILQIHRPRPSSLTTDANEDSADGIKRLAFEELLAHRISMRQSRNEFSKQVAPQFPDQNSLLKNFFDHLPFKLTNSQIKVIKEIAHDLNRPHPMLRLLQGDVGSGKTIVAAASSLLAIGAGFQVTLMAPTELLAEQHNMAFEKWFRRSNINVGCLTAKIKGKPREKLLEAISSGNCQFVSGTHALFQEKVNYHKLGLIIVDEQHRFGVHQRLALRNKALSLRISPHQLMMTATPIPRTLAMSAYANLDNSVINELPPGRTPIKTAVIPDVRREEVINRINTACTNNQQAYWVCTLIDESDILQAEAAEATATKLTTLLPNVKVGLLHGRVKPSEKVEIMERFKANDIQLLVATTVIEVGVDVPNASLMVIENSERLGLAQLHQLRGRVGRGAVDSCCLLLYHAPLSTNGNQRLAVLRATNDGFVIAEKDLELRGAGQVLGTQQTGIMSFRIADLNRDTDLLEKAEKAEKEIFEDHPDSIQPLIDRWIGGKKDYAQV
jgi:ATP-dependent DNA helicase RecG